VRRLCCLRINCTANYQYAFQWRCRNFALVYSFVFLKLISSSYFSLAWRSSRHFVCLPDNTYCSFLPVLFSSSLCLLCGLCLLSFQAILNESTVTVSSLYYTVSQKNKTPYSCWSLRKIFIDFQNSFTAKLSTKFAKNEHRISHYTLMMLLHYFVKP